MNQNMIKVIGLLQQSRDHALKANLSEVEGLKKIIDNENESWIDFDSWEDLSAQQWIFSRALDVYKGRKIDICCTCCEYNYVLPEDYRNKINEKCLGIRTAFMIEKVLDEIIIASARRSNDGTYLS